MSDISVEGRVDAPWMPALRIAGVLVFLLAAGCAGVKRAPPPAGAPQEGTVATQPADRPAMPPAAPSTDRGIGKTPATVPAEPARKRDSTAPSPGKPAAPPLDLAALEKRLRETDAIGVFTKIALKNQVDDLVSQFRAYYQGRAKTTLAELRQPYDMLLLKVLSLVQDSDPALAKTIVASREAIWSILADPAKFATTI